MHQEQGQDSRGLVKFGKGIIKEEGPVGTVIKQSTHVGGVEAQHRWE